MSNRSLFSGNFGFKTGDFGNETPFGTFMVWGVLSANFMFETKK